MTFWKNTPRTPLSLNETVKHYISTKRAGYALYLADANRLAVGDLEFDRQQYLLRYALRLAVRELKFNGQQHQPMNFTSLMQIVLPAVTSSIDKLPFQAGSPRYLVVPAPEMYINRNEPGRLFHRLAH